MQIGVKWVYQNVKDKMGRPQEAGQRPTLCFRGQEYMLGISIGYPVRVIKRPVKDFDVLRTVTNGASKEEYPVQAAVDRLRDIAKRNGITIGASKLLDRALQESARLDDEDQFENEEELTSMQETVVPNDDEEVAEASGADEKETTAKAEPKPKSVKALKRAARRQPADTVETSVVRKNAKVEVKEEKKTKAAKPAAKSKAEKEPKAAKAKPPTRTARVKLDFEKQVLPFIVKEFKKLKDPNDPPRGFGKGMYAKIAEEFGCSIGAGDQFFWKAKWEHAKALGIKGTKKSK